MTNNTLNAYRRESMEAKGTYMKAYVLLGAMCKEYRFDSDDHDLLKLLVRAIYGKESVIPQ